jgi:hypothetical protein
VHKRGLGETERDGASSGAQRRKEKKGVGRFQTPRPLLFLPTLTGRFKPPFPSPSFQDPSLVTKQVSGTHIFGRRRLLGVILFFDEFSFTFSDFDMLSI